MPRAEGIERQPVRQPAGVLGHRLDPPGEPAGYHQIHEKRAQGPQNPASHQRAEKLLAGRIALAAGFGELPLLFFAQARRQPAKGRGHGGLGAAETRRPGGGIGWRLA